MKLFGEYISGIERVLDNEDNSSGLYGARNHVMELLNESVVASKKTFSKGLVVGDLPTNSKTLLDFDHNYLKSLFGANPSSFDNIQIGSHPDFEHLQSNQTLKHHCVSMFVDIKGSTRLSLNHSLEDIRLIKDSLLTLSINIANFFGGHIHRLQGDAAFIQFVRKERHPNDAIINALNMASVLCQFVSNDLAQSFESRGLKPIKIRIGIDYGKDDEVLWSYYGIPGCNELTTTSLHTDLAAKLQNKAKNNSIRIGKNIVEALDLPDDYYSIPRISNSDGTSKPDYYILQSPELNYAQYDFDWKKHLIEFQFMGKDQSGKLEVKDIMFELRCFVKQSENEEEFRYFENSFALPKGYSMRFVIYKNGYPYHRLVNEKITWEVENRGNEANIADDLNHDFKGHYHNETQATTNSAYLGHHFLKCKIVRQFGDNINLKFPVFVQ
ncbi:nucleotide-binding domain-containing protein [Rasiella sp. SM2506]|uniref:nucleotide-binding domain-containing protein n=1 Tax=Rasiella sp. SM2506 TaxID=3423914 RepID=UPI003D7BEF24